MPGRALDFRNTVPRKTDTVLTCMGLRVYRGGGREVVAPINT